MEKYPWINFKIDLRRLPLTAWIQLGECTSKCEHLSRVPLKPGLAEEMHKIYLAKGAQATTAIEGNTLTEEEVRLRIEDKLELPPSKEYLGQEIDNILDLCNEIGDNIIKGKDFLITARDIFRYNKIILNKVPIPEHVIPDRFRQHPVGVGLYKAPDFKDVPALMKKLCDWLNSSHFDFNKDNPIINSIVKAIIAHLYIAWIHPFGDGNGRVARILEFAILMSSGVPSPAAHLLSNHYNATRNEYYRQLDLSSRRCDVNGFTSYAIQGFLDGLKDQLGYIFAQNLLISWESYIYEVFREERLSSLRAKRIRALMLELSKQANPVPKNELITLSPILIEAYRNRASKTLERDLLELEQLDLIVNTNEGYRAKMEKIFAFLPRSSSQPL